MQTLRKFIAPVIVFLFWLLVSFLVRILPSSDVDRTETFAIPEYRAEYVVGEDRRIEVKEDVTVRFFKSQHGIIRDLPMDYGVRYEKITATRDGQVVPTKYRFDSASMISLAVGDEKRSLSKDKDYVYNFSYTMIVPVDGDKNLISLDVLGFDWQAKITKVSITVTVPDGLLQEDVFSGLANTEENERGVQIFRSENTISLTAEDFGHGGITLDMQFEKGVLGTTADLSVLWAILIVVCVAGVFALYKIKLGRNPLITRTVNLTAPDEMDPLLMGKILDDKVDSEDLGALVFWLASEGYLIIDLSVNDENPTLIKTEKELPIDIPVHVSKFYEGLFTNRDRVRISQLNNSFYRTAEAVKTQVSGAAGKTYSKWGKIGTAILAAICVFLFGGFALLWNFFAVGGGYLYFMQLVVCAAAFAIAAGFSYTAQRLRYKWSTKKRALLLVGSFLLSCVSLIVVIGFPSAALTIWPRLIFSLASSALGLLSGFLFTFTEEHAEKLGHILGFRDFILYTEKDKIEFMLKENPELYYKVLPYAQVLGITNAWTEKFKGLDMPAPSYAYYRPGYVFHAHVWHRSFRNMNRGMGRNMVSRPSNSGGGGHGGHRGGGGGRGHGGGGGRSF